MNRLSVVTKNRVLNMGRMPESSPGGGKGLSPTRYASEARRNEGGSPSWHQSPARSSHRTPGSGFKEGISPGRVSKQSFLDSPAARLQQQTGRFKLTPHHNNEGATLP